MTAHYVVLQHIHLCAVESVVLVQSITRDKEIARLRMLSVVHAAFPTFVALGVCWSSFPSFVGRFALPRKHPVLSLWDQYWALCMRICHTVISSASQRCTVWLMLTLISSCCAATHFEIHFKNKKSYAVILDKLPIIIIEDKAVLGF